MGTGSGSATGVAQSPLNAVQIENNLRTANVRQIVPILHLPQILVRIVLGTEVNRIRCGDFESFAPVVGQ